MTAARSASARQEERICRSASVSHPGAVRRLNRDRLTERSDAGLWAVADAMGSDNTPGVGSAAIAQAIAKIADFETQYEGRRAVRATLADVNERLFQRARDERLGNVGSSTVVLLIREDQYACLWVGNCRAYHFRGGALRRITSDHSLDAPCSESGSPGRLPLLTRAVGSQPRLDIDAVGGEVASGDRFLLCSDGATVLDDGALEQVLAVPSPGKALEDLLEKALAAGASDNVTAMIVDV